ncbi:hypothetical protein BDF20DRAFT_987837 [Mycotypha africana]|uniref:uncharacterized protein n=1 Tax=Mycotypha africana TaxID=64632 RepID=UPI002301C640|nr:uncharacterized protein BDF20DRAFT_987837 [Mycotypha africana]KAI8979613.1 hypothetical protein BDF20DRAFT_987837 [Mycotypha africana]
MPILGSAERKHTKEESDHLQIQGEARSSSLKITPDHKLYQEGPSLSFEEEATHNLPSKSTVSIMRGSDKSKYLCFIWSYIIELLFNQRHSSCCHWRKPECILYQSQKGKYVKGKKKRMEVSVAECVKKTDINKAITDIAKLFREYIDGLMNHLYNMKDNATSYAFHNN